MSPAKVSSDRADSEIPFDEMRTLRGARGDDNLIEEFTDNRNAAYENLHESNGRAKEPTAERQQQREKGVK